MTNRKTMYLACATLGVCTLLTNCAISGGGKDTPPPTDSTATMSGDSTVPDDDMDVTHNIAEANSLVVKLGEPSSATSMAFLLDRFYAWTITPSQVGEFSLLKNQLEARVRKAVVREVADLHAQSLACETGQKAGEKLITAGEILSLYRVTADAVVQKEAAELVCKHAEVGARLPVLQRMRYNQWAVTQIDAAIGGFNKNNKSFGADDSLCADSLVKELLEVDPTVLDPVALDLYTYIVTKTNESVSEEWRINIAKRLTDPTRKLKLLGEF